MPKYRISESVSGEKKVIIANGPVKALIKYLETEVVNIGRDSWNWDFEIVRVSWSTPDVGT